MNQTMPWIIGYISVVDEIMDLSQKKSDLKFVENEKDMTKIIGSIDKENKQEVGITFSWIFQQRE